MSDSELVYSTEQGRMCQRCKKSMQACSCVHDQKTVISPKKNSGIFITRERKGRNGKVVTLVHGLPLNEIELKFLLKELKQKCGTGGTLKEGVIEIQGEQYTFLVQELTSRGYKVK